MLYLFSGKGGASSVQGYLRRLAASSSREVHVTLVDKRLGPKFDLTQSKVRQRYLDLVDQGYFDIILLSPSCATFSRATWANFSRPRKLRPAARDRQAHGEGERPCYHWQHFCWFCVGY